MQTIKFNKGNMKVIAHRGLSSFEAENSLASFISAGNRSYFGIECDMHLTKDGKYVVFHDDNLVRMTGFDAVVEETDFNTIRSLNLFMPKVVGYQGQDGVDISDQKRPDLIIPTMQEYILTCKKYDKVAVLELKNHFEKKNIQEIIEIIESLDYLDGVIFISFDIENLIFVKELRPNQTVQFLSCNRDDFAKKLPTVIDYKMDVDLGHWLLTKDDVIYLHSLGIKINVWTPGNIADAEKYAEWGVDYLTTNYLE
jgi:glycerophosphoryl diester phosphodiesterase